MQNREASVVHILISEFNDLVSNEFKASLERYDGVLEVVLIDVRSVFVSKELRNGFDA